MKHLVSIITLSFFVCAFTTTNMVDKFEVLYDSKPIPKEGIILQNGKSIQIVNTSGGKVYKVVLNVVQGKRPCYQKTFENADASNPIPVAPILAATCTDATIISLTVNMNTVVNIPIVK